MFTFWTVCIDMDEVVCDFVGGALKVHGWTKEQWEAKHPPAVWGIYNTMNITRQEMWEPINMLGSHFWSDLDVLPWAQRLVYEVVSVVGYNNVRLLSAPQPTMGCYEGKQKWIHRHSRVLWPVAPWHCILSKDKESFANETTILIDDKEDNVSRFINAGGRGIVFPSLLNRQHANRHDPVPVVIQQLKELLCT